MAGISLFLSHLLHGAHSSVARHHAPASPVAHRTIQAVKKRDLQPGTSSQCPAQGGGGAGTVEGDSELCRALRLKKICTYSNMGTIHLG